MSSDKQAYGLFSSMAVKGLSKLSESISGASGDLKFVKVEHGLGKIAKSIIGASVVYGSIQLLSTSSIGLNKFEIEILRQQKSDAKPSNDFLFGNYVLMASAVVFSLGMVILAADQLKN
jgi:hypothetical protein